MAESNGQQDDLSRLDRIERAMELFPGDHESFRAEHKMLLRSQVLQQEALDLSRRETSQGMKELRETVDHLGSKIDLLVDGIARDHHEFHEQLKRLENKEMNG